MIPEELIEKVIAPALTETGERWFRRRCAIYQERCATGYLRRKLDAMIDLVKHYDTHVVVMASEHFVPGGTSQCSTPGIACQPHGLFCKALRPK